MNLNLQVCDNFLPQELFNNLQKYCLTLPYSAQLINYEKEEGKKEHVFYSCPIQKEDPLLGDIEKAVETKLNIEVEKVHLAAFTLVNTKKPMPHIDKDLLGKEKHLIIYLNGEDELNSGTGFYSDKKNKLDLNTCVGCYPNRAVIFDVEDCYHSPLLFSSQSTSRYSLILWFKPKEK